MTLRLVSSCLTSDVNMIAYIVFLACRFMWNTIVPLVIGLEHTHMITLCHSVLIKVRAHCDVLF